ncbi:MAG: HEAT repeat domain-containing protein [Candidatus Omnitrophica bacterium]|nr:HEAT repeat domain-containing protein [Candidatus Omnitrophota bacterium]
MLGRSDMEPDAFYTLVNAAFASPLRMPDITQQISEDILSREDDFFPLQADFFGRLYNEKITPFTNVRRTSLKKTLQQIDRYYKTRGEYGDLFIWLEQQPLELVEILEVLLKALYKANRALKRAYADLSPDEIDELRTLIPLFAVHTVSDENTRGFDQKLLDLCNRVHMKHVLDGTYILINAIEHANKVHHTMKRPLLLAAPFIFKTAMGTIIVGSTADDHYNEQACLVLDLEGNDTYADQAGTSLSPLYSSLIVDFDGNDRYTTRADNAFASGLMNIAVLFDKKGHDSYHAGNNSCGNGIAGAGVLIDHEGDDEYRVGQFGIGAGAFGLGVVYDKRGNDYYSGKHYCQGFSMTKGIGMLVDLYGNDFYSAGGEFQGWAFSEESYKSSSQGFSMGIREYAGGGFAYLLDGTGNDSYHGAALCQGAGYWLGIGVLHDTMGNDFYSSIHYAQGVGVHFGFGCLLDNEGSDFYKSVAASQGLGYHRSIGMLVDYAGDDCYNAKRLSAGSGSLTGIGILNDKDGNDTYQIGAADSNSLGRGTVDESIASIGLFFDEAGDDHYIHSRWFQNTDETDKHHGLRSDGEKPLSIFNKKALFIPRIARPARHFVTLEMPDENDPSAAERLYTIMTSENVAPQTRLAAAKMFISLDKEAVDFLIRSIRSQAFVRSLQFPARFIKDYGEELIPRIMAAIENEKDDFTRAKFIVYLKFADDPKMVLPLLRSQLRKQSDPITLATTTLVLTHFLDIGSEPTFIKLLRHDDTFVVLNAINALQTIRSSRAITALPELLDHDYYGVRDNAALALHSFGDTAIEHLKIIYPECTGIKKRMIDKIFDDYKDLSR